MKKLLLIFVLLPMFILYSCKKNVDVIVNPAPSKTETIAKELQNLIDEQSIKEASVYVFNAQQNNWDFVIGCSDFKVENPYIQVCGTYYNLSKLVKFKIQSSLELYFKY